MLDLRRYKEQGTMLLHFAIGIENARAQERLERRLEVRALFKRGERGGENRLDVFLRVEKHLSSRSNHK